MKSSSTRLSPPLSIDMESEEGDARSIISGSLKESVELLPDQLEEPSADAMNGELYDEPGQNQFPFKAQGVWLGFEKGFYSNSGFSF